MTLEEEFGGGEGAGGGSILVKISRVNILTCKYTFQEFSVN